MSGCWRKETRSVLFLTIFDGLPLSPSPNDFLALEKTFCFFLGVRLPTRALKTLTLRDDDLGNANLAVLMDLPTTCFEKLVHGVDALYCLPWNVQNGKVIFQSIFSQCDWKYYDRISLPGWKYYKNHISLHMKYKKNLVSSVMAACQTILFWWNSTISAKSESQNSKFKLKLWTCTPCPFSEVYNPSTV